MNGDEITSYTICYKKEIKYKTSFKWEISGLKGMAKPVIYLQTGDKKNAIANIYEVWLLK